MNEIKVFICNTLIQLKFIMKLCFLFQQSLTLLLFEDYIKLK